MRIEDEIPGGPCVHIIYLCNHSIIVVASFCIDKRLGQRAESRATMKPSRSESDLLILCFASHPIIRTRHDFSYGGQQAGRTNSVPTSNVHAYGMQPTPAVEQPPPRQVRMTESNTSVTLLCISLRDGFVRSVFLSPFPGDFDARKR
jgi:hypothetical protein